MATILQVSLEAVFSPCRVAERWFSRERLQPSPAERFPSLRRGGDGGAVEVHRVGRRAPFAARAPVAVINRLNARGIAAGVLTTGATSTHTHARTFTHFSLFFPSLSNRHHRRHYHDPDRRRCLEFAARNLFILSP